MVATSVHPNQKLLTPEVTAVTFIPSVWPPSAGLALNFPPPPAPPPNAMDAFARVTIGLTVTHPYVSLPGTLVETFVTSSMPRNLP